jgi:hypothetical protein
MVLIGDCAVAGSGSKETIQKINMARTGMRVPQENLRGVYTTRGQQENAAVLWQRKAAGATLISPVMG